MCQQQLNNFVYFIQQRGKPTETTAKKAERSKEKANPAGRTEESKEKTETKKIQNQEQSKYKINCLKIICWS